MRNPGFQRCFAHVALVATLLLALVPTAGRLAGEARLAIQVHAPAAAAAGESGVAHHGHHEAHHAGAHRDAGAPADAPGPADHHGEGDCAYCPLLASLLGVAPAAPATGTVHATDAGSVSRAAPAFARIHPTGLGSRGPPRIA